MKLHLPTIKDVTLIENVFIDQYMPHANGEFVKLYLYLLRCAGTDRELSLSRIADVFDHTEKDVKRALAYWEKLNLLKLEYDGTGNLCDIQFLDGTGKAAGKLADDTVSAAPPQQVRTPAAADDPGDVVPPPKSSLTRDRKKELKEQTQIKQLIFVAEQYFSRPLTTTEQSNLLYFYDTLHFSADLIEYLIEYCISKGTAGPRYMEKVAQEWYRDGITTVAEAKKNSNLYKKTYFSILSALGIRGRNPVSAELQFMDHWMDDYGFTVEIIQEACGRTIRQIHEPKFEYADTILSHWHDAGVRQLSDIQALDQAHSMKKSRTSRTVSRSAHSGRFNNFPQRDYDWNQLEQQLLQAGSRKEG